MVLVIGYGNPLRQDDSAAWHVAQRVEERASGSSDLHVVACHQLTPELAELLSTAARAVFVDASVDGSPGTVGQCVVTPSTGAPEFGAHRFGPSELLATARALFGASPESHLVTVTGQDFGYGVELSAPVRDALDGAAALVAELVYAAGA